MAAESGHDVVVVGGGTAGIAAALAARLNIAPRELDVTLLQRTLRQQGATLNTKCDSGLRA